MTVHHAPLSVYRSTGIPLGVAYAATYVKECHDIFNGPVAKHGARTKTYVIFVIIGTL